MLTIELATAESISDKFSQSTYSLKYNYRKYSTSFNCLRAFEVMGVINDIIKRCGVALIVFQNKNYLLNLDNKHLLPEIMKG
jgi:hypothetical protein